MQKVLICIFIAAACTSNYLLSAQVVILKKINQSLATTCLKNNLYNKSNNINLNGFFLPNDSIPLSKTSAFANNRLLNNEHTLTEVTRKLIMYKASERPYFKTEHFTNSPSSITLFKISNSVYFTTIKKSTENLVENANYYPHSEPGILISVLSGPHDKLKTSQQKMHMLRISEDNDYMNFFGLGTDNQYTNGPKIEWLYINQNNKYYGLNSLFPKAGINAVNIVSWGISQLMYTPDNLEAKDYLPSDYSYSGALLAIRSLYSYNFEKKYALKSEMIAGVRGPLSFAKETQKYLHKLLIDRNPMGWDNQLSAKFLFNYNLNFEKELIQYKNEIKILAGSKIFTGNLLTAASLFTSIIFGKIEPHFGGDPSLFFNKNLENKFIHISFFLTPEASLNFNNAMIFDPSFYTSMAFRYPAMSKIIYSENHKINKLLYSITFGPVISWNKVSLSVKQNYTTSLLHGLYDHCFGNITFSFMM